MPMVSAPAARLAPPLGSLRRPPAARPPARPVPCAPIPARPASPNPKPPRGPRRALSAPLHAEPGPGGPGGRTQGRCGTPAPAHLAKVVPGGVSGRRDKGEEERGDAGDPREKATLGWGSLCAHRGTGLSGATGGDSATLVPQFPTRSPAWACCVLSLGEGLQPPSLSASPGGAPPRGPRPIAPGAVAEGAVCRAGVQADGHAHSRRPGRRQPL